MLKPLADRVLIRLEAKEEKTKSGIFLPDTAKEKPQEGVVVAVGAGKVYDNGQRVAPEVKYIWQKKSCLMKKLVAL